jgi:YidC/Oxa1 family membrane protein insertase
MEKRLLVAVAVSILIIITFQYFAPKPVMPPAPLKEAKGIVKPDARPEELRANLSAPGAPVVEEKDFVVDAGKHIITFSNIGGAIKNIQLKEFKNLKFNEILELIRIKIPQEYIGATSSGLSATALDTAEYKIEKDRDIVIAKLRTKDFEITKQYNLSNIKYAMDLQISIKNISDHKRPFSYDIVGAAYLQEADGPDNKLISIYSKVDGKVAKLKTPKLGRVTNIGNIEWVALKSKYFSVILKPLDKTSTQFYFEGADKEIVTGVSLGPVEVDPGQTVVNKFVLYAGPSAAAELKKAECGLEETMDYGFFGGITKVLLVVVEVVHSVVRSWGVSIILLSVFLNIILFPLTMKSFKSMQKMQELHPQMEKLKAEHKGNPQKLNKEVMELYKKYKINPLSGCLPMLLQMPIFFALYQALMQSIELRGTRFLWIGDLSSPDIVRLPFTLPFMGDKIHILPLIMVGAMLVQQKMSTKTMGAAVTEEQKQQQKMMLIMMPIMFGLIFYNMPSGLVLYWIVNTVLTVVEQGAILRRE